MRKTITILATLAATALAGVAAQPAAADDPQAWVESSKSPYGATYTQTCYTPDRWGITGQYGAWGNYVDGCTAKLRCDAARCTVYVASGGLTSRVGDTPASSYQQTCNVRLRAFDANGAFKWHRDGSTYSTGANSEAYRFGYAYPIAKCSASAFPSSWRDTQIQRGEWATVQANGVRSNHWNPPARAQATVTLIHHND